MPASHWKAEEASRPPSYFSGEEEEKQTNERDEKTNGLAEC
jgi:hypothetical protein